MIELNLTAIIQFVNFLITFVVLNFLLISPIRKIIKRRKETMEGLQASASEANEAADSKLANYNASLAEVREKALAIREELRSKAIAKEHELTEAAATEAHLKIQEARIEIAKKIDEALGELKGDIPVLARQAVDKMFDAGN